MSSIDPIFDEDDLDLIDGGSEKGKSVEKADELGTAVQKSSSSEEFDDMEGLTDEDLEEVAAFGEAHVMSKGGELESSDDLFGSDEEDVKGSSLSVKSDADGEFDFPDIGHVDEDEEEADKVEEDKKAEADEKLEDAQKLKEAKLAHKGNKEEKAKPSVKDIEAEKLLGGAELKPKGSPSESNYPNPAPEEKKEKPNNPPISVALGETLKQSAEENGLEYADVFGFISMIDSSAVKTLSTKYDSTVYKDDCNYFVQFLAKVFQVDAQRSLGIVVSEVVSYLKKNTAATFTAIDIIMYCNELYAQVEDKVQVFAFNGIGYTKMKVMVDNAFIIEYLTNIGISKDLKVGNNVDARVNAGIELAVAVAYHMYENMLGDSVEKYRMAYQRIEAEKPEMLKVIDEGDYESFYKMLRTFGGSSTVGIDIRDIDLNVESYSPGEAAALYAAVIAKMDELSARYHRTYDNEDVERVVDSVVSRGYRASQTNAIEYYCEELLNPKKPIKKRNDKDTVSVDNGMNIATKAYIPAGYGLSKSHIEISKPYTEVFGIPFINIRHPLFRTIAMKYSNRYTKTKAKKAKGKLTSMDSLLEKRMRNVEANAEKAERQLIKEIKKGSLMSKFLSGDTTKDTQVEGEGLGLVSTIEKGLRKVTSFASNPILIKNILKLIKMALDGEETPVSRSTLVVATNRMNAYDRNPLVSNYENDMFTNVRVVNPTKPEKSAAVSKKYLKQFYDIVNPLENADEYIACGAFSTNLVNGADGRGLFKAQMNTVSTGAIDPSSVSDAAITLFRQDIMAHGGYPYTYVLTDQFTGENNQVYKIARNNNFFGDLIRLDVDLVAIHVKKAGMDGIFIMENHDAEVLFS